MITFRKNIFSANEELIELVAGESLHAIRERVAGSLAEHYCVILDGVLVEDELLHRVVPKRNATILVAPNIRGGSGREVFKQVAVLAVVAAITIAAPFSAPVTAALAAGAGIATTLLLNALIPPITPGLGGLGDLGDASSSQMYTITSQQNSIKKFGHVPKVYGKYRMFPTIASNPYTEIETSPDTGELIQYYYAIYDFGLGPAIVSDLKIGDTPLSEFSNYEYRFVDFNKPAVRGGDWDDYLNSSLALYKGDIQIDSVGAAINGNKNSGDPLSEWQLVRNASASDGSDMEILLNFVCPKGLTSYGTTGTRGKVDINLEVHFSRVGEDTWYGYNDRDRVSSFEGVGSATGLQNINYQLPPVTYTYPTTEGLVPQNGYVIVRQEFVRGTTRQGSGKGSTTVSTRGYNYHIGLPAGTTQIKTLHTGVKPNGSAIYYLGAFLGNCTWELVGGYWVANLSSPMKNPAVLLVVQRQHVWNAINWMSPKELERREPILTCAETNSGKLIISRNSTEAVYSTVKFSPKISGDYKVRIRRVSTAATYSYQVLDELTVMAISTRFDRSPIITDKRHVFMELKIRATNQLNGSISNLSGVVSGIVPVWTGTEWDLQESSNPAWVLADLITGDVNKRKLDRSRLDLPSLVEWANYCDEVPTVVFPPDSPNYGRPGIDKRYECNFILDFETTLQGLINSITGAAQASLNLVDGKYGVLLDKRKNIPVQLFTPRNSWGFTATRTYQDKVEGIIVGYIDGETWEVSEVQVLADGYSGGEIIDKVDSFACTSYEQAWRFGRYMLAQATLRKETITISVDFEHLVCTRGDYVKLVQDSMLVGGTAARVVALAGNEVTLDCTLSDAPNGYAIRTTAGIFTGTAEYVSTKVVRLLGSLPAVGDLIVVGQAENVTLDCIVKAISVNADMTATLTLVEKNDAIFDAETGSAIPTYNPQIGVVRDSTYLAPPLVDSLEVTDTGWDCDAGDYFYYIDLFWTMPSGAVFDSFEIYVDSGKGLTYYDNAAKAPYRYRVTATGVEHKFAVLAVGVGGEKLSIGEAITVSATVEKKTTPPSNVEFLALNITNETLQLNWNQVADCDVKEYLIRYSPQNTGSWEASIPLLRVDKNTTMGFTQARTGTYLIKAVDFANNESNLAARAITSIPSLTGLNVIQQTSDFPTLPGELVSCEKDGDTIVLKHLSNSGVETSEYYSEGYYYYANFLDLGEIYTVRLQSRIEAEGFTVGDLMSSWATLADLAAMSQSKFSEWDVETQVRVTDKFNVISEWSALSDVAQMSEGDEDNWSEWRSFTIGDFTGRIMQFRLKLISNKPSVTPRVFSGEISSDMPDRIESANNVLCPVDGIRVEYSPAFKAVPAIAITIDGASAGDYYNITDKTVEGFTIVFYDKDGVKISRQFDWMAKGYGRKATKFL